MEEIKPETILAGVWTLTAVGTSYMLQVASVEAETWSWELKWRDVGMWRQSRQEWRQLWEQDKESGELQIAATFCNKQNDCDVINWNGGQGGKAWIAVNVICFAWSY